MDQLTGTILGLFFVFFGLGAVLAMLENWGNKLTKFNRQRLTLVHRVFGYLFVVTYIVILYFMFRKIIYLQEPLEPLIALHAVFALLIFPLLFVKILIVRRFTGLIEKVPYFGIAIFALGLTLNILTGGFYLLRASTGRFISLTNYDRNKLNVEVGRGLLERKCMKCHTLERVFTARKTEEGWTNTVNAMVLRDPSIREEQAVQIIHYLSTIRSISTSPEAMRLVGMELTDKKCGRCHALEKLYRLKRTPNDWIRLIGEMRAIEPAWISHEDVKTISRYLLASHSVTEEEAKRGLGSRLRRDRASLSILFEPKAPVAVMSGEEIFKNTCNLCHNSDRIFAAAGRFMGSKEQWRQIVEKMKGNGADIADQRLPALVDYLVTLKARLV
ncbi:MAG: hypothetical protein AABZ61_13835 [Bacteroidota bacterium]